MKQRKNLLTVVMFAAGAWANISVQAETVNIPYETAASTASCQAGIDIGGHAGLASLGGSCQVVFPITLPAGYTIKQIAVLYSGSANVNIDAYVATQAIAAPWSVPSQQFSWVSAAPVPAGTVARANLMGQVGKSFPDAFSSEPNRMYHVVVDVEGGAMVNGLQVMYDSCINCF